MSDAFANGSDDKGLMALEAKMIGKLFINGIEPGTTNAVLYAKIGYPDLPPWRFPPGIMEYAQYLIYYSQTGDELMAIAHANVTMMAIERRCRRDKAFDKMRKEAKRIARSYTRARLEQAAVSRAVDGVDKTIYWQGIEIGTERVYSDSLMSKLLDRVDKADLESDKAVDPNALTTHDAEAATRQIFRKLLGTEEDGGIDAADAAIEEDAAVTKEAEDDPW